MSCFDCRKVNADEALEETKQLAKQKAIETNEAQAIYKEGNEWHYTTASAAISGGYPIAGFVSQYN